MVILIGASVRAMAGSALRAGWTPWCADLFGDADLIRLAPVRRVAIAKYPRGLIDALAGAPPGPLIYCGGLENRPDLIERIDRPLWGNPPDVLKAIRTPNQWTALPAKCGACMSGSWRRSESRRPLAIEAAGAPAASAFFPMRAKHSIRAPISSRNASTANPRPRSFSARMTPPSCLASPNNSSARPG